MESKGLCKQLPCSHKSQTFSQGLTSLGECSLFINGGIRVEICFKKKNANFKKICPSP